MKFMNTINKLQAALTELRREIQRSEAGKVRYSPAIDPHRCFVCGIPADMGIGNALGAQIGYCRKHMPQRATGTAGECTCERSSDYCSLHYPKPSPDFPLHVRVARVLGWTKFTEHWERGYLKPPEGHFWRGDNPIRNCNSSIPDYPNDLVAAMAALEEYCSIDGINFGMARCDNHTIPRGTFISTLVTIGKEYIHTSPHKSLPQAICEAIVAYSEGK